MTPTAPTTMTPLQRFVADHTFILDAVAKAAGLSDPVAVDEHSVGEGSAHVDAEHAVLASARPGPAARRAAHGRYLGATPSMAVDGPEKERSS